MYAVRSESNLTHNFQVLSMQVLKNELFYLRLRLERRAGGRTIILEEEVVD